MIPNEGEFNLGVEILRFWVPVSARFTGKSTRGEPPLILLLIYKAPMDFFLPKKFTQFNVEKVRKDIYCRSDATSIGFS